MKIKQVAAVAALLSLFFGLPANAVPLTLEGMGKITSWIDLETTSGEMPGKIWGTSDTDLADRVGIFVKFANGLEGTATYSGVSGLWNTTNFTNLAADTKTGFFDNAGGDRLHFLVNSALGGTLPMAWDQLVMAFSGNFDLDYNTYFGSHFRASVAGWASAEFATYSSTASVVPLPAALPLFGTGLAVMGLFGWRRKRKSAAAV
ncbi:MAG: hypothetical protein GY746_08840 [Gammaproteobacteria bacterium]|nr:hypothetical protein [Gammaproteobacteria bacterium]